MPSFQAVDSGHCSCHPEEKRTVRGREKNCTSPAGKWGSQGKRAEKALAARRSTLAWKIPRTEEPVHGIAKNWTDYATSLLLFTFLH